VVILSTGVELGSNMTVEEEASIKLSTIRSARSIEECKWFNNIDITFNTILGFCFAGAGHYWIAGLIIVVEFLSVVLRQLITDKAKKIEEGLV
jgi:hypothetical protein